MYTEYLNLAIETAKKAGDYLLGRKDISIDSSNGKDIKLSSDRGSESIIIEELSSSEIPILSEESGLIGFPSNSFWIIDPLDGSMNYYKGIDGFSCVSIALWDSGEPVVGVINRFERAEIFTGVVTGNAMLNDEIIKPSSVKFVSQAVMATGFPVKRNYTEDSLSHFVKQVRLFKKVRMLGSAAIMSAFVACGRLDAYFEEDIMLWDIAAAMAIVKSAGGAVDYQAKEDYKCVFRCFATHGLMEDYSAEGL
ncbi:MAG: hypothetical protein FWB97_03840 [Oscillospiraceae bacterium]|nr:hypothetical protein [Oscillospiraceae bacterium]